MQVMVQNETVEFEVNLRSFYLFDLDIQSILLRYILGLDSSSDDWDFYPAQLALNFRPSCIQ